MSLLGGEISVKMICELAFLKMFSRSDIKGQGLDLTQLIHNGEGIHFDGVALRLTFFVKSKSLAST